MPLPELENLIRLDHLFHEFLRAIRRPIYGIAVTDAEPDLSIIHVEFRFLANRSYCCAEPDCHLPRGCQRLIRLAAEHSIALPDNLIVRWHCIVEEGARLQVNHAFGVSAESRHQEFDAVSGGAPTATAKPIAPLQEPPPGFTGLWITDQGFGRKEIEYVNGIPNGRYRSLNAQGVCLREGFNKNGLWHGKLITRNAAGAILDECDFYEGTGTYKIFYADGELSDEIPMKDGKPQGAIKRCALKVVEIRHYLDGNCIAANCES